MIEEKCLELRQLIIKTAFRTSAGAHFGGSLSLVEILEALYSRASISNNEHRDRIILSKGHGALALYCILMQKGIIAEAVLNDFEQNGSELFAHAKRNIARGIEFSGGSLSLGVSFAIGVALACRDKAINNRIYVVLGDGECNEGLVWESIMAAANYHLNNLTFIVDRNHMQSDGDVDDIMKVDSLATKFSAFGCRSLEVDGHSIKQLLSAMKVVDSDRPVAIIANTVKGKGVSFMENNAQWHYASMSEKQYQQAMEELNRG